MDLLSVLPGFATKPYAHLLPSLERSRLTTVDLITLDTLEIAKRAHVPPADVRRFCARVIEALHADVGFQKTNSGIESTEDDDSSSSVGPDAEFSLRPSSELQSSRCGMISTLDPAMDALLGGGIQTGYLTEVTGESGSGKTQFLLSLLLAVQLAEPRGLQKRAIYISTEHVLATNRLSQLLECHPYLSSLPADQAPTLENVLSINAMDMETQDHILNYQLPVAIARYDVGLVIIDSITSNYRAENNDHSAVSLSTRSTELARLGQMLRNLAAKENIAIVIANQVSDRFGPLENVTDELISATFPLASSPTGGPDSGIASPIPPNVADIPAPSTQSQQDAPPSSSEDSSQTPAEEDPFSGLYAIGDPARIKFMTLMHQERFFTGWGDTRYPVESSLKTPAMGYFWSTQIACRIALKKETRSLYVPWDGGYPLSTPLDQMDPPEEKVEEVFEVSEEKPGFETARQTHTGELEAESEALTSEKPPPPLSPRKPIKASEPEPEPEPFQRSVSAFVPEPEQTTRRIMKVVFAPWTGGVEPVTNEMEWPPRPKISETAFEIWEGGLRSIDPEE
ncbi:hypothetical protein N7466_011009 [Penicillium verhagenii]|uniref:uncharacterized protein n=1 Tax=Penicillium verhagenii TaxID=1562060 RepID=UPI002544E63A|nr:uncharacterized protein N7466_011009 [Penicillium verhagenii]KAJ5917455.1 hypothetical protein N7466_011009 [Penicillium verhagenii]